jgi:carboxymethylenebutenolidase
MSEIDTQSVSVKVEDGSTMAAYVARPRGAGKLPGLLVFQEAFGVNGHIKDVTRRFAAQGYVAIAPELFHRTNPGFEGSYTDFSTVMPIIKQLTVPGLDADAKAAFAWLKADAGTDAARISAIGFCMGGRTAYLANSILPLRSAVSFYGGISPDLLARAAARHGPLLMFWGGQDKHIPPEGHRPQADALRAAGKPFVDVEIGFADHGFFCDARAAYNADAAAEAWPLTLAFLSR